MKKRKFITIDKVSVQALTSFSPEKSFSDGITKANLAWWSDSSEVREDLLKNYTEISIRNLTHKKHCISIDEDTIKQINKINNNFSKSVRILAKYTLKKYLTDTLNNERN